VIFDFRGVNVIGQAFADEIFRVFARHHPEIRLIPTSVNTEVRQMIQRAISAPPDTPEVAEEVREETFSPS